MVDIVIGVFALIGMVVVALIIACVLTPILLWFLDTIIKYLAWVLSVSSIAEHISKVVNKFSPRPNHTAYETKNRIYIPKPIQDFIYSTLGKGGLWQAQKVKDFKASHKQPLVKDTLDMVSQPVKNKVNHSRENLSRGKRGCQPKANKTLSYL